MIVAVERRLQAQVDGPAPTGSPASWASRAGALALDVLPGIGALCVMVELTYLALSVSQPNWLWIAYAAAASLTVVLMAANRLVLPGLTGWTLGRAVFCIRVTGRDGCRVGAWRLLGRELAHLLDTAGLMVGWLWPLWDSRKRTFGDLLLRTEVRRVMPPDRNARWLAARVLAVTVVVCASAAAMNYVLVYRNERAVQDARKQMAEQGPRIVEQMLSYKADTLNDDFKRAQDLASESYRSQLVAQQERIRKKGASSNEYWAVSSAVLSASAQEGAMLLAMQGQRGESPQDLRFITATVRVQFTKSRDGRWQVTNLNVLQKPVMPQAPQ